MRTTPWRLGLAVLLTIAAAGRAAAQDNQLTPKEKQEGWQLLFDGKEAKNWKLKTGKDLPPANVQDGCINPHKCGSSWTYYDKKFGDFILSIDFKIDPKCNSGIFFRVADPNDEVYSGFEMQVIDRGLVKELARNDCGAIYDCLAPTKNTMKPAGQWNHVELTCADNIIQVVMNGEKIIDMDLNKWNEVGKNPDGSKNKFKKAIKDFERVGYIGVQEHGENCWYKNIKVKPIAVAKKGGVIDQPTAAPAERAVAAQPATKHLLLISESKGFKHGCVDRKVTLATDLDLNNLPKVKNLELKVVKVKDKGKQIDKIVGYYHGRIDTPEGVVFNDDTGKFVAKVQWCLVESTMVELGKKNGFDVVCSQDSRTEITPENLKNFDAVFFYTTGELPLSDTQKDGLLSFVRSGKGFGGSHSATDTFYGWKDYGELIGAYFDGHPWHTKVNVIVEDKTHPATKHLGDAFTITDEIYQFRTPYDRSKLHVLMRLDLKGLPAGKRADGDNALAWTNQCGEGRVFYTALGHRDEVWQDPRYQQHVIGGLRYLFFQD